MTEPQPRDLAEGLYMKFAAELLSRLAAWTEQTGVPHIVEERPHFHDDDPFPTRITRETPYYAWTLFSHLHDPFWGSGVVLDCAREHYERGLYPGSRRRDKAPKESLMHNLIHSYLPDPVVYTLQIRGPEATLEEVRQSYREFADKWSSSISRYDISVPLVGITGAVSGHELELEASISDRLRVAPMTADDKNRLWRDKTQFPYRNRLEEELLGQVQFQLTGTFSEHLPRQFPSLPLANDIYSFLLALRLYKAGDVGTPTIFRTSLEPTTSDATEAHSFELGELRSFPQKYILEPGDLNHVRAVYQRLDALDARNGLAPLHVALHRYMQSCSRSRPEDYIIDVTIALESCLLGRESELAYKFSLRGAALLVGTATLTPTRVKVLLAALYASRNKIVHEGRSLNELASLPGVMEAAGNLDVSELPKQWEELARLVLHEFQVRLLTGMENRLPSGKMPKPNAAMGQIREELDGVLVEGLEALHRKSINAALEEDRL